MRLFAFNPRPRPIVASLLAATAILGAALLSACGGGGGGTTPTPVTLRALNLSLGGLADHVGQRTEWYVTDDTNVLWLSAIYDPLPSASLNVNCPKSLSNLRTYNCAIWTDANANGTHDVFPTDPNWIKPIPLNGVFNFIPDTNYANFIPAGFNHAGRTGDFRFNVVGGLDAGVVGKGFEARVIDSKSGRTAGIYHLGAIPAVTFSVSIPDIINASSYRVDFYIDENGDGQYNAPPVDHAWRRTITVPGTGDLVVNFTHDMVYTDIGF